MLEIGNSPSGEIGSARVTALYCHHLHHLYELAEKYRGRTARLVFLPPFSKSKFLITLQINVISRRATWRLSITDETTTRLAWAMETTDITFIFNLIVSEANGSRSSSGKAAGTQANGADSSPASPAAILQLDKQSAPGRAHGVSGEAFKSGISKLRQGVAAL
jgi:hypothetical protein